MAVSIEVVCGNIESVLSAKNGGADRVELCSALSLGGLTPSVGLFKSALKFDIDLFVMIRPREGDFIYSDDEFESMKTDIEYFKSAGAKGIVSGILTKDGEIDFSRTEALIKLSRPLPFTFHRAFDLASDPIRSLETLIKLKADRLLTSGQASDAWTGRELIAKLVSISKNKISIMAGAGIGINNVTSLVEFTGVNEIHLSGKIKRRNNIPVNHPGVRMGNSDSEVSYIVTDPEIIKKVRNILDKKS